MIEIVIGIVALAIGVGLGKILFKADVQQQLSNAKSIEEKAKVDAETLLREAKSEGEAYKKERALEAKERFFKLKEEHNQELDARNKKVAEGENRIKQKEQSLNQKLENANRKEKETEEEKTKLVTLQEAVAKKRDELNKAHSEHVTKLEQIAKLTAEEAKAQLVELLKDKAQTEAMSHVKNIMDEAKLRANKEAKKIVIQSIQRTAAENTIENSVSVFNLSSDDQKGQIIGREGRNIRALEAATGVEIIVDDTPEAIIISG